VAQTAGGSCQQEGQLGSLLLQTWWRERPGGDYWRDIRYDDGCAMMKAVHYTWVPTPQG